MNEIISLVELEIISLSKCSIFVVNDCYSNEVSYMKMYKTYHTND